MSQTMYDVIDKILDSKDVTVGGGSASAVAAAMSAGLVGMVARLSLGKDYGLSDERYIALADELDGIGKALAQGCIDDTQAFLGIKAAFALPKGTDDEKAVRRAAVEDAAVKAATVPMENAKRAARILDICMELVGKSNPAASSDIECGVMFARSAIIGGALNIEANLPLVKTEAKSAPLAATAATLKAKADAGSCCCC